MGSPVILLQNSGLPVQPAATSAVLTIPDAPVEMTQLPAGSVLPAVIVPAENASELPVMQLTLPDGQVLSAEVKTSHFFKNPVSVNIKVLPLEPQKSMAVRVLFSTALSGTDKVIPKLPDATPTEMMTAAPSDPSRNVISVKAFVPRFIPEEVKALLPSQGKVEGVQNLPVLKPNQSIRLNILPQPEQMAPKSAADAQKLIFSAEVQTQAGNEQALSQASVPMQNVVVSEKTVLTKPSTGQVPVPLEKGGENLQPVVRENNTASVLPSEKSVLSQPQTIAVKANEVVPSPVSNTSVIAGKPENPLPASASLPVVETADSSKVSVPVRTEQSFASSVPQTAGVVKEASPVTSMQQPEGKGSFSPFVSEGNKENQSVMNVPLKGVVVDVKEGVAPFIVTKAGVLALEEKIQLPHLMPVSVQITEVAEPSLFVQKESSDETIFQAFSKALEVVRNTDVPTFEAIRNLLPQVGNKVPAHIFPFIHTASQNTLLASFLGEANMALLQSSGEKGRTLLKELDKDFSSMPKKVSDGRNSWNGWTIPFLSGALVQPVSLYLQKPAQDGSRAKKQKTKQNTVRFILDLNLTQLGRLQMDGLSHRNERRFDLIFRHEKELPTTFDDKIHRIFTETLTAMNYTGTVKVDQTDQFVTMKEEMETIAQQGVWA